MSNQYYIFYTNEKYINKFNTNILAYTDDHMLYKLYKKQRSDKYYYVDKIRLSDTDISKISRDEVLCSKYLVKYDIDVNDIDMKFAVTKEEYEDITNLRLDILTDIMDSCNIPPSIFTNDIRGALDILKYTEIYYSIISFDAIGYTLGEKINNFEVMFQVIKDTL
jgi:hypothetical protein